MKNSKKLMEKLKEALKAVLPIIGIVLVLCFSIAPISPSILLCFLMGGVLIILGMMFFTLGAEMAMTPMGERVGTSMTKSKKLWVVIPLSFLLMQLAEEFYPILTPSGKSVHMDVPENLILPGDPDKLARVFNNILKNAAAYSFPDTVIEIRARKEAELIHITFTNQGPQIPREQLDVIFEKFYRLDSARSSEKGGAGLGLAIAKEIVAAHHGTISAESDKQGTTFSVVLPAI